jgi:hypothetical protein
MCDQHNTLVAFALFVVQIHWHLALALLEAPLFLLPGHWLDPENMERQDFALDCSFFPGSHTGVAIR